MKRWKLLKTVSTVLLGLLVVLFLFRITVFEMIQPTPSVEEVMAAAGDWGWLVGVLYPIVQQLWLLFTLAVILIAAWLFCTIMEVREDGFRPLKLISTIISSVVMVGTLIYLLIMIYGR